MHRGLCGALLIVILSITDTFDKAYCPPGAFLSLSGFSSTISLLSGLADKALSLFLKALLLFFLQVGVTPEVFQRGRYKG